MEPNKFGLQASHRIWRCRKYFLLYSCSSTHWPLWATCSLFTDVIFLASSSFMDVAYSSSVTPRLISHLFFGENTISFQSGMIQIFTDHFLVGLRSSFCWWEPMTAMWPTVSPCIIWLSWGKGYVLCYWWCPRLEVFCTQ